jgi:hypothetical protein
MQDEAKMSISNGKGDRTNVMKISWENGLLKEWESLENPIIPLSRPSSLPTLPKQVQNNDIITKSMYITEK